MKLLRIHKGIHKDYLGNSKGELLGHEVRLKLGLGGWPGARGKDENAKVDVDATVHLGVKFAVDVTRQSHVVEHAVQLCCIVNTTRLRK